MNNQINKKIIDDVLTYLEQNKSKEALELINEIETNNPKINALKGVLLVKNQYYKESVEYLLIGINNDKKNELNYLSLYIAYFKLKQFDLAFKILFEFLKDYPANLFLGTLEELLEGLKNGYSTNYKKEIIFFAKKNNIEVNAQS
jgi:tetratricopeptide (TPR) repeat protein